MNHRRYRCGRSRVIRRGVTLLEIILALGILIFVSSMTYWFYSSSLETSREGTAAAQKLRLVRIVLDRMATEIRQASAMTVDNWIGIRGEAEAIRLSSYRVPSREQSKELLSTGDKPPPAEYDLTKVEYKIVRHPEILHEDDYEYPLGLARIEIPVPRPAPALTDEELEEGEEEEEEGAEDGAEGDQAGEDGFEEDFGADDSRLDEEIFGDEEESGDPDLGPQIQWDELYAPEIRYLRFCYYDGYKWWDSWDVTGENPLPQLVMVTVGFECHPPFGEELGLDEINEEFCECLNEDPVDCEPLMEDQFSMVVRVSQSDPLFRSRVSRETQAMVQELGEEFEE